MMSKELYIREIIDILCSIYNIEKRSNGSADAADNIMFISKFINKKYPDIDVVIKLINNLIIYREFGFKLGFKYINMLKDKISDTKHIKRINKCVYDNILKLIDNEKITNILFNCLYIDDKRNKFSMRFYSVEEFMSFLSDFPVELFDKISSDLNIDEILFLLILIIDKDSNMKISDNINSQNYTNIIKQIIGNSEVEIKLFELIYPYFGKIPCLQWYDLYNIMTAYKDRKNVVEYFAKNIKTIVLAIEDSAYPTTARSGISFFIWNACLSSKHSDRTTLSYCIDNDVPLSLFYRSASTMPWDFRKFIVNEIIPKGIKFPYETLEYDRKLHHMEEIIVSLYDIYKKNKSFTRILIDRITKKDQYYFYILSELINKYKYLFNEVISKDFYSNSNLINFLLSLLDKDERDMLLYINMLIDVTNFINLEIKSQMYPIRYSVTFRINGEVLSISGYDIIRIGNNAIKKKILTYVLMFLISKNDLRKSSVFVYKFKRCFRRFVKKNIIFDDQLLEFIYSNPESKIRSMLLI